MSTTPERTSGASEPSDLDQLTARLDELQRRTEGLTAALEQSRSTRRLIVIAFLGFVILSGWRFYALGNMIRSPDYQARLLTEVQKSVASNQDNFSREAQKLVDKSTPIVTTAFSKQSEKDMPKFMKIIDRERATLLDGLGQRMAQKIENHHHELLRRHDKLFQEEFPAAKDKDVRERMMGNTCLALDRLVKKYYFDEFQKELKAMDRTWEEFPVADKPAASESPLESQLIGELMDLLAIKFSRSRSVTAVAP